MPKFRVVMEHVTYCEYEFGAQGTYEAREIVAKWEEEGVPAHVKQVGEGEESYTAVYTVSQVN